MLENISPSTLPRLMKRTGVSALIVGIVGFVVAVLFNPLAGLGEAVGLSMAILNLRFLDKQVAKVEIQGEQTTKAMRRQIGGKTISRLALFTVIVLAALYLSTPLGIGIVAGLVLYQIVFVVNVARVLASQGRP